LGRAAGRLSNAPRADCLDNIRNVWLDVNCRPRRDVRQPVDARSFLQDANDAAVVDKLVRSPPAQPKLPIHILFPRGVPERSRRSALVRLQEPNAEVVDGSLALAGQ